MYTEEPPPLYISYVSPEQTNQGQHQEMQEPAGHKGLWINKVTKVWWDSN